MRSQPRFAREGVFPQHWLPKHANSKEMYALSLVLRHYCTRHPERYDVHKSLSTSTTSQWSGNLSAGEVNNPRRMHYW